MATSRSNNYTSIVPLNGKNYATWKVQVKMALMRENVWSIVAGTEVAPGEGDDGYQKYLSRKDSALAIIVLSIDPTLLYLLGDPADPKVVWEKIQDQFQKKTWANKLELRRRLYSMKLLDSDSRSVDEHIKMMTEVMSEMSIVGDPIAEEDKVVHLLASLPDSFKMLVTAFESLSEVPSMETVTERIRHEAQKSSSGEQNRALAASRRNRNLTCHFCKKVGHIKRECYGYKNELKRKEKEAKHNKSRPKANKAVVKQRHSSSSSEDECVGLVVRHALSSTETSVKTSQWIIDSGATSHMCNDRELFVDYQSLEQPVDVALGDEHKIQATARGTVILSVNVQNGETKLCKLHDVLYVPELCYNLLSVARVTSYKKTVKFSGSKCFILDVNGQVVAMANKTGSLYYLDYNIGNLEAKAKIALNEKQDIWHRRYGHLGEQNLNKIASDMLVDGFDYSSNSKTFCEPCVEGKHHRSPFSTSGATRSEEVLGLVHSDVCGKVDTQSLSGAEYFLTFIDDKSRYTWVYVIKRKSEVFQKFVEWKALVEKSTGKRLKVLRTDNGGEYTSAEFENYLKGEGIRHELTVPKTPEQNGVAERMNRTLVETVRCMLTDGKLPKKFWAEAINTAVYIRNRGPTKAVKGMTPYEALTGKKPNVSHFRTFGCIAYAHVAKDERHKLDPKAKKCIFLGYGPDAKGYRLYDLKSHKVIISRDVVFNELSTGVTDSVTEKENHRFVEFDSISDIDPVEAAEPQDEIVEPVEAQAEPLQRPRRDRRSPNRYGEWVTTATEPVTVKEARSGVNKAKWELAMEKEMESLKSNEVWDLVKLPEGRSAVGSKWVFKLKTDQDGSVERHKARLVAQGFSQKQGLDYDETFCPVARYESVRTVIALAVQNDLKLHQMDVTTAFLNGELQEEVYMRQPEGFVVKGKEDFVCKLKKSIYGLKQSPRCWNSALDNKLKSMGFVQTPSDPCLYIGSEGELFIIAVYVDDILLACKNDVLLKKVKKDLASCFDVKDMGELKYFLGMKVVQQPEKGSVWIGQPAYVDNILEKFGLGNAKEVSTPADPSTKLEKAKEDSELVDKELYQSAVGSLLYLSVATRPDITYAVNNVARYCAEPTKEHMIAVKRIMRYLKGTRNFGLEYTKDGNKNCIGFSDADWAGNSDDRKSISGYVFQISGAAVSWKSKKQQCVALSTAEAEYMALSFAAQEAIWMKQLVTDLNISCGTDSVLIFEDNQAAMCIAKNPQYHGRSKHIDIKYHFIREQIINGNIKLKYCATQDMVADIFTKALSKDKFVKLRDMTGVKDLG